MKLISYFYVILLILFLFSCNRMKSKAEELAEKTEQKVRNKSKDLMDKIVPRFDAYEPDTKYNKLRFKDFLKVELTPDIRNIYCFDDAVGIDADFQFAFNCDTSTVRKIIEKHGFTRDTKTTDYGFGLQNDFDWWDKQKIEKLPLYSWNDGDQYFKYFWYDTKEQKAYYFDFDL